MNTKGDDIASQQPFNKIDIQKVGLLRNDIPVDIVNPFTSEQAAKVTVYCKVKVSTFVPASVRGVHMSRMNNAFAHASLQKYPTILEYAQTLARSINECHFGGDTTVTVTGTVPVFAQVKGWKEEKDKLSLDHVGIRAEVVFSDGQTKNRMGIQINHITACPCVQKTFAHAANLHDLDIPLMTHSQRTTTYVDVDNLSAPINCAQLLEAVEGVVHRVHNTLPREYELAKVHDAHQRPQFAEDVIRDVAVAVSKRFLSDSFVTQNSNVHVHATSAESIHDFDILAELQCPLSAGVSGFDR